jgi:hypothetical protein
MNPSKPVRWSLNGLLLALLILGLALLVAFFLPYPRLKALGDLLARDGDLESFTPYLFMRLRPFLAGSGVGLLLAACLGYVWRLRVLSGGLALLVRLAGWLRATGRDAALLWRELRARRASWPYGLALLLLTVLGGGLRLVYLSQPMRYDEAYTFLVFAMRPFGYIVSNYPVPNNHVLHTLLVALAYRLLGGAPWVIRLPAFLAGLLLVPATYLAALALYERRTALLSAGCVAASSFLIEYSTDARGYILMSLLALCLLCVAVYVKDHKNRFAWLLFVFLAAAGFYTLPIMLYPLGAIGLWLLLCYFARDVHPTYGRSFLVYLFGAGGAAALLTLGLYAPIIRGAGLQALTGNPYVAPLGVGVFVPELLGSIVATWKSWIRDIPPAIVVLLVVFFLASLLLFKSRSAHRLPLAPVMVAWCLGLVLLQRVAPWARVWLFLMPFFFIWVAAGALGLIGGFLERHTPRGDAYFIAGVLLLSLFLGWRVLASDSILTSGQTGTLNAAQPIALYLKDRLHSGDVVVSAVPSNYPLRYYFYRERLPEESLYRLKYGLHFQRAWIVVNLRHGQSLEDVLAKAQLTGHLDPSSLRQVQAFDGALLYLARPQAVAVSPGTNPRAFAQFP